MDLKIMREWLIERGVDPEYLDKVETPKAIDDIANTVVIALQNDNQLGGLVTTLLSQVSDLEKRVSTLEGK